LLATTPAKDRKFMEENRFRFGVGVLVVAAVGVFVILTFLFGAFPSLLTRDHTLIARFDEAPGISTNTAVLRDGVKIGRVSDIRLVEDGVRITMEIEPDKMPSRQYVPRVSTGSFVTGEANLEFVRLDDEALLDVLDGLAGSPKNSLLDPAERKLKFEEMTDGEYIDYGQVAGDPFNAIVGLEEQARLTLQTLQNAGAQIEQAGASVKALADQTRDSLGGGGTQLTEIADQTSQAVNDFQTTLADIRQLVNNPNLKESIDRLPTVTQEAENTLLTTRSAIENLDPLRVEAERAAENVSRITGAIADESEELAGGLVRAVNSVEATLEEARVFAATLNRSEGTVQRLIEDDDLYWQIRRVVDNVEGATARIRPILDDVRVLSDKLARDPRQLGVKGALDRRPTGYGLK